MNDFTRLQQEEEKAQERWDIVQEELKALLKDYLKNDDDIIDSLETVAMEAEERGFDIVSNDTLKEMLITIIKEEYCG